MIILEFLKLVSCPRCKSQIKNQVPFFNNKLVCLCRRSTKQELSAVSSFKLSVTDKMFMYTAIYPNRDPLFYIAEEERPFYPLVSQNEIPDYIFLPLEQLVPKLELLITFS